MSSGYEIGGKPYKPNNKREYWASSSDFLYASVGNAFKMDLVTWLLPFMFLRTSAWAFLLYLLCLSIFVVPIFLLQSFMGQFSSSSYISVFRLSPTFKGIGYISLLLNFCIMAYQSIFAGIPLLFLVHSFRRVLPWSCASYTNWPQTSIIPEEVNMFCRENKLVNESITYVPSVLFVSNQYRHFFNDYQAFSWTIFGCILIVWGIVYVIALQRTAVFGRIIRYLVLTAIALLLICLLRALLLPSSMQALRNYFRPIFRHPRWPALMPVHVGTTFVSGWGSTIAMASFNKFKSNIVRYSWCICGLQVLLMFLLGMFVYLVEVHLSETHNYDLQNIFLRQHWEIILSIPSAMGDWELPHLWCIGFSLMLLVGALVILTTQLYGLITALLDEFSSLRAHRHLVLSLSIASLVLASSYFCLNHKMTFFSALSTDALFTQTSLNLLLILVVLWIYGRLRFQRDFEFMLGRPFANCWVQLLRFVTPICGLFILWFCFLAIRHQHWDSALDMQIIAIIFLALPWLFIPGYLLWQLMQTSGPLSIRFRRIARPTDWYPLLTENRQRYADLQGNLEQEMPVYLEERVF